ncbi:MAG: pyruvate kinase [Saprospiraceae bacterium]
MKNQKSSLGNTVSSYPCQPPAAEPLIRSLLALRKDVLTKEEQAEVLLDKIHPDHIKSARNLLHYLAFRSHDLREMQLDLTEWGLSSLGRAERKVQATIDAVLIALHKLTNKSWQPVEHPPFCFKEGRELLEKNTEQLLGSTNSSRRVRIMVTMPSEAADNYDLVKNLMANGMNCARINCAHDDARVWSRIIENIRKAEEVLECKCKIHMDLGGPKLRTGDLEHLPSAMKVKPTRNPLGKVVVPAKIWLFPEGKKHSRPEEATAMLPVSPDWLKRVKRGDVIKLSDARKADRKLKVVMTSNEGCLATCTKTIYFRSGLNLEILRDGKKVKKGDVRIIVDLEPSQNSIHLAKDDLLYLTRSQKPGRNAEYDEEKRLIAPATIPCSLPEIFEDVQVGEPIWFDDGKIGGIVESKVTGLQTPKKKKDSDGDEETIPEIKALRIRITQVPPKGGVLRSEKGINLPETELRLKSLTQQDLEDLEFVVKYADIVGLSFANRPEDVEDLVKRMQTIHAANNGDLGHPVPSIVLKIETQRGFKNLPSMLLAAMQTPSCGVMIARGDLAIECGFGRLSEVQEQMLWTCEAAHVPVIWATQVLEGLAKNGLPTRAEVTDAAMGQRAECIMLNKGPHIVEATQALGDILDRMQDHQTKKRSLLRKLRLAERFFEKTVAEEVMV